MSYVDIPKIEMDNFLLPLGFEIWEDSKSKEYIYKKNLSKDIGIFIYSSIDKRSNWSRDKGKDAIRIVCLYQEEYPIGKEVRTHRIETWKTNLGKKIDNLMRIPPKPQFCRNGHIMVRRKSKRGEEFMGCSKFPECKESSSLPPPPKKKGPECHGPMEMRKTKRGHYWRCNECGKWRSVA